MKQFFKDIYDWEGWEFIFLLYLIIAFLFHVWDHNISAACGYGLATLYCFLYLAHKKDDE